MRASYVRRGRREVDLIERFIPIDYFTQYLSDKSYLKDNIINLEKCVLNR